MCMLQSVQWGCYFRTAKKLLQSLEDSPDTVTKIASLLLIEYENEFDKSTQQLLSELPMDLKPMVIDMIQFWVKHMAPWTISELLVYPAQIQKQIANCATEELHGVESNLAIYWEMTMMDRRASNLTIFDAGTREVKNVWHDEYDDSGVEHEHVFKSFLMPMAPVPVNFIKDMNTLALAAPLTPQEKTVVEAISSSTPTPKGILKRCTPESRKLQGIPGKMQQITRDSTVKRRCLNQGFKSQLLQSTSCSDSDSLLTSAATQNDHDVRCDSPPLPPLMHQSPLSDLSSSNRHVKFNLTPEVFIVERKESASASGHGFRHKQMVQRRPLMPHSPVSDTSATNRQFNVTLEVTIAECKESASGKSARHNQMVQLTPVVSTPPGRAFFKNFNARTQSLVIKAAKKRLLCSPKPATVQLDMPLTTVNAASTSLTVNKVQHALVALDDDGSDEC